FSDPDSYEENDEEKDLDSHIDRMLMLCEERSSGANAMIVGQEAFVWVYRFVKRFAKRHNNAVTILIFSLGGENYEGKEYREQADEEFQKILQMKIRSGDVVTNKANLFFAIFPELENQNVHIVIERINNEWEKTEYSKNFKIEYRVRNKNYKTSENK
ncbi:MAG: hypothetical protein IJ736_16775, partial [Firmicutes bacterium]|nr:hypothetical protein [Bacillota bacterium]